MPATLAHSAGGNRTRAKVALSAAMETSIGPAASIREGGAPLARSWIMRLKLAPQDRFPLACLTNFVVVWGALAIAPVDRATWALEHIPTVIIIGLCIATYRRFRFSDRAYAQGLAFQILHAVGGHFTYARSPIGAWAQLHLGLMRNPYDRVVHFAFGLLLFLAADELFVRTGPTRRRLFLAFTVIAWWSLAYELLEWIVAVTIAPEQGLAFLASQGDEWDTQKDMAMACVGAAIAWAYEAYVRREGGTSAAARPTQEVSA
jgi:putative membrane protein